MARRLEVGAHFSTGRLGCPEGDAASVSASSRGAVWRHSDAVSGPPGLCNSAPSAAAGPALVSGNGQMITPITPYSKGRPSTVRPCTVFSGARLARCKPPYACTAASDDRPGAHLTCRLDGVCTSLCSRRSRADLPRQRHLLIPGEEIISGGKLLSKRRAFCVIHDGAAQPPSLCQLLDGVTRELHSPHYAGDGQNRFSSCSCRVRGDSARWDRRHGRVRRGAI